MVDREQEINNRYLEIIKQIDSIDNDISELELKRDEYLKSIEQNIKYKYWMKDVLYIDLIKLNADREKYRESIRRLLILCNTPCSRYKPT